VRVRPALRAADRRRQGPPRSDRVRHRGPLRVRRPALRRARAAGPQPAPPV